MNEFSGSFHFIDTKGEITRGRRRGGLDLLRLVVTKRIHKFMIKGSGKSHQVF